MAERLLAQPVFILGCNRSGTTLLFQNLSQHPLTWSLYLEAQHVYYRHYPIHDEMGDRLADPPPAEIATAIESDFYRGTRNRERFKDAPLVRHIPRKAIRPSFSWIYKRPPIRLVEKTPANTLRVPFLAGLFPDARFLFLVRRGEDVVSSLMEGWKFWSRKQLGGRPWRFTSWHYIVPPGWRAYRDRPLEEICAFQWLESNRIALNDLKALPRDRYRLLRHEDLLQDPEGQYRALLEFCELPASSHLLSIVSRSGSRVFTTGGSPPRKDKWRQLHGAEIERIQPRLKPMNDQFYAPSA